MIHADHARDRLGFCHSCGARNGEPHHLEPEQTMIPDDALASLAKDYVIIDGHWIKPAWIATQTPGRVVCTNGKTFNHQEAA